MTAIEIIGWSIFGAGVFMWLVLVLRKFSLLASIDLNHVRAARDRVVKHDIAETRLRRKISSSSQHVAGVFGPLFSGIGQMFAGVFQKLQRIEAQYRDRVTHTERKKQDSATQKNTVMELLSEAEKHMDDEELPVAEKKYIEAISLDPTNAEAYRGLGRAYIGQKDFAHARASLVHAAKLDPKDPDIHCTLAEIYQELDKMSQAVKEIMLAVELQPNNPKYLDYAVELAIKDKDVYLAEKTLARLRKANEENQKIEEYENQIFEIKTKRN